MSLPQLIEIKERVGREQDLADVKALEKIEKEEGGHDKGRESE